MPTRDTPADLLDRAVRSVLDQTWRDLALVVVNDGGASPDLPADSRVVCYEGPGRGRYWCDAVVRQAVRAVDPEWWLTVHDADDVSERERFDWLLADPAAPAVLAPFIRHEPRRRPVRQEVRWGDPRRFSFVTHWCATAVRAYASPPIHPGYVIGWDAIHTALLRLSETAVSEHAHWHWHRRDGTLSRGSATGSGSIIRGRVRREVRRLYEKAVAAWDEGTDPWRPLLDDIPDEIGDEVAEHAERLAEALR